jgi:hypothetical protein
VSAFVLLDQSAEFLVNVGGDAAQQLAWLLAWVMVAPDDHELTAACRLVAP